MKCPKCQKECRRLIGVGNHCYLCTYELPPVYKCMTCWSNVEFLNPDSKCFVCSPPINSAVGLANYLLTTRGESCYNISNKREEQ